MHAGVHQSFAGIGEVCRANGTLFLADTVCSLGGVPFFGDAWGVDAMYSGSQKALAAPPGAAPLMLNERAFEKLSNRKTKPATYQNDLTLIGDYWGWYDKRFYHHTGMVSMTYAMREALEVVKVCTCSTLLRCFCTCALYVSGGSAFLQGSLPGLTGAAAGLLLLHRMLACWASELSISSELADRAQPVHQMYEMSGLRVCSRIVLCRTRVCLRCGSAMLTCTTCCGMACAA